MATPNLMVKKESALLKEEYAVLLQNGALVSCAINGMLGWRSHSTRYFTNYD